MSNGQAIVDLFDTQHVSNQFLSGLLHVKRGYFAIENQDAFVKAALYISDGRIGASAKELVCLEGRVQRDHGG